VTRPYNRRRTDRPIWPVQQPALEAEVIREFGAPRRLVAYLHLRMGMRADAVVVWEDIITSYAKTEKYQLDKVFVALAGRTDIRVVGEMLEHVQVIEADAVLVVGPSRRALAALAMLGHRRPVSVLTLGSINLT
jgi:hypothetical protein